MSDSTAPKLYESREPVFPRRVSGHFRRAKWIIMALTLGVYYLTPWIRWNRGPELPDQAVLVDLANRRFYFFWIEIWSHEFYFVAGLLIMAGLGLFLFTSALGRVWCGYACPQTVWTDLFILTERWIEGDRNKRIRLWNAKWTGKKIQLRIFKYTTWAIIGLATGGAWVFYFTDAPQLAADFIHGTAHPVAYTTMAILTTTTVFFGGFAREQVCIYACPWPRIQSAMVDEDTLTIGYRDWRGEPRGKQRKSAPIEVKGDCIDCHACANVCPVGIDIRDGQQLECITCGLCIDACNDIMDKIGKPRGLIDYYALSDETLERAGEKSKPIWKHIFRPRTIVYTTLWSAIGIALLFALFIRADLEMTVSAIRNPTYVTLSDGTIRNTFEVGLRNKHGEMRPFALSVTGNDDLGLQIQGDDDTITQVPADTQHKIRVYVTSPRGSDPASGAHTDFSFWLRDLASDDRISKQASFIGNGTAK